MRIVGLINIGKRAILLTDEGNILYNSDISNSTHGGGRYHGILLVEHTRSLLEITDIFNYSESAAEKYNFLNVGRYPVIC